MCVQNVFTHRLGTITSGQIQAALDRHDLGKLQTVAPAAGGSFGQVLLITSSHGEWVFKGAPLIPDQLYAEWYFTHLLHSRSRIPVPWPYLHDVSGTVFPWDFALMPRLPGCDLGDPAFWHALPLAEQREIAIDMGACLAAMASITFPRCGAFDHDSMRIKPYPHPYGEEIHDQATDLMRRSHELAPDLMPSVDQVWIADILIGLSQTNRAEERPSLAMQDFKDQNMVGSHHPDGWRITGLFDLGGLHAGDPCIGLCRQIAQFQSRAFAETLSKAFVRSALTAGLDPTNLRSRVRGFTLMERLAIWEWALRERRDTIIGGARSFRSWAEPTLELVDQILS